MNGPQKAISPQAAPKKIELASSKEGLDKSHREPASRDRAPDADWARGEQTFAFATVSPRRRPITKCIERKAEEGLVSLVPAVSDQEFVPSLVVSWRQYELQGHQAPRSFRIIVTMRVF